jgi:hypothetical protein
MKVCTKCKVEKELTEFCKNKKTKDGLESWCKVCKSAYNKIWRAENRDGVSEYNKKWNAENKEYFKNNKEKLSAYKKEYNKKNREEINAKNREYNKKNKRKRGEYEKKRRAEDPLYKLRHNVSCLIGKALSKKQYTKKSRTHEIFGCSYKELLQHLNNNPYGFVFGDKDTDVDHITPVSSATTEDEVLRLNHYTNFQLLPSEYNRYIKIDNEWDEDHFRVWLSKKTKNIKNCYIK